MDQTLRAVIDMSEFVWNRLKEELKDLTSDEVHWRPLQQANSIALIVRHLRIEAEWQVASLEYGEAMPTETTEAVQRLIDSVDFDFERNSKELVEFGDRFVAVLRDMED